MAAETIAIIAGIVVPIIGAAIGLIVRAHHHHARDIKELDKVNTVDHKEIRKELNALDEKAEARHGIVRDKIEKIWQHLVKDKKD